MVDRSGPLMDNQQVVSDKQVAVRLSDEQIATLDAIAERLGRTLRKRVTRSDVVRLAVEDYVRRNG